MHAPTPKVLGRTISKRSRRWSRQTVLKMLAVMEAQSQNSSNGGPGGSQNGTSEAGPAHVDDFLLTGRTGRRNALPDILGSHAIVGSSDLASRLQALSTKDLKSCSSTSNAEEQPGTSSKS